MNTTMAPTDQIRQEFSRRRHESIHELRIRVMERDDGNARGDHDNRRDGGSSSNGGGSGSKGNGNGDGNGNGNGNGNGKNDNSKNQAHNDSSDTISTSTASVTSPPVAAATSTTVDTTSAIPFITTTPAPPTPTSTTSILSGIPMLTVWPPPLSAPTSNEPQKGLDPDRNPSIASSTSTGADATFTSSLARATITSDLSTTATPASAVSSSSAAGTKNPFSFPFPANRGNGSDHHPSQFKGNNHRPITPLTEHLLIAFGTIGAFIIFFTAIYFIMRMRKHSHESVLSFFRNRKFERGGSRGWYGWRKQDEDYTMDPPPQYSAEILEPRSFPPEKDNVSYSAAVVASPASDLSPIADPLRSGREGLLDNAAPFGHMPAELPVEPSATESFYNIRTTDAPLNRQVSNVRNNSTTQGTMISRQPSDSNYNNTYRTGRTSNAYDPNQREVNHLSYLSSLSSGFGDGLILADSTTGANQQPSSRQSQAAQADRFSWVASQPRDTIYTNSSVDTAPRFRSVNSWVAQQSGRVERQRQSKVEVPNMPTVPLALRAGTPMTVQIPVTSPTQNSTPAPAHQRNQSDDPRFNFHPGDEVEISRGSRVPSSVLDKNIGVE